MNSNSIKILCTLGPNTLNKKFLNFAKGKVSLLRLNISHIKINKLKNIIRFLKKNSNIPLCIDTEGAQIRTKVKKTTKCKQGQTIKLYKENKGNFNLYPKYIFKNLKKGDLLYIGFDDLKTKVVKIKKNYILLEVSSEGLLENNKGVHLQNRRIKLNYLTEKDFKAIEIAKKYKVKNFALSFTNTPEDVRKFGLILKYENKIYKIETKEAVQNIHKIAKAGKIFLIDRGDLSKETSVEKIPSIQRKIFKIIKKFKNKEIYVATNLLESMIYNKYPTRGEANDIYSSLEMGASGLVLAAETAIGKYPQEAVKFLKNMIYTYLNEKKYIKYY